VTRLYASRLVFHGAVMLLIGMLVGLPAFVLGTPRRMDDEVRLFFRQSHLIPVATGAWMIAVAGGLPYLSLSDRGASGLVWSLVISAYSLVIAQAAWFATLHLDWSGSSVEQVVHPSHGPLYAVALTVTALTALFGTALIARAARASIKESKHHLRAIH
jgi:hypothetical protein